MSGFNSGRPAKQGRGSYPSNYHQNRNKPYYQDTRHEHENQGQFYRKERNQYNDRDESQYNRPNFDHRSARGRSQKYRNERENRNDWYGDGDDEMGDDGFQYQGRRRRRSITPMPNCENISEDDLPPDEVMPPNDMESQNYKRKNDSGFENENQNKNQRINGPMQPKVQVPKDPMIVFVYSDEVNLTKVDPFNLSQMLNDYVNVVLRDVTYTRNGKLKIKCENLDEYNLLKKLQHLGKYKVKVEIPEKREQLRYVTINGVDPALPIAELKTKIDPPATAMYRIYRQGVESDVIKIGYKMSGGIPPEVRMGFICFKTREVTHIPPRCYRCQRFGHILKNCKSRPACPKCSEPHEYTECPNNESTYSRCVNCGGDHSAGYGGCPAYKQTIEVNRIRAHKKVSYAQAVSQYRHSYPNQRDYTSREEVVTNVQPRDDFTRHQQPVQPPRHINGGGDAIYTLMDKEETHAAIEGKIEDMYNLELLAPKIIGAVLAFLELYVDFKREPEEIRKLLTPVFNYTMGNAMGKSWIDPIDCFRISFLEAFEQEYRKDQAQGVSNDTPIDH